MIVIFDSGIGGFEFFNKFKTAHPNKKLLYYADSANFPYGNKSRIDLENIIKQNFAKIASLKPAQIILACNTASMISENLFGNAYQGIPITDTLQYIKKAAQQNSNLTILATVLTAQYMQQDEIFKQHTIKPLKELAFLIENNQPTEEYIAQIEITTSKVLYACTHFPLAHDIFAKTHPAEYINPVEAMIKDFTHEIEDGSAIFFDPLMAKTYTNWEKSTNMNNKK